MGGGLASLPGGGGRGCRDTTPVAGSVRAHSEIEREKLFG